ncbi:DUF4065 domain-containing protein [Chitinophaga silvatica]|uniref:DUF4065 domain-containing protein n=1 Tax=Chitinophaga silvatica TaxID=2282649 RepID=A0A3E1YAA7_9BACT|nr:type II toxin-antitoxin system antitoxin SocA domain-containing protein [Chitinophaga silvatica]RFS22649.1 DUF4065 domain-containing protein [Chitinophaga silvatica]
MKAKNIAEIIVTYFDSKGDLITNKKLQKLLYYIEGWSLVHLSSIIDEDFEAWIHGPVIPSIYTDYKEYGYSPIVNKYKKGQSSGAKWKELIKKFKLAEEQIELIVEVLNKYGVVSSLQLELLSHSEEPWLKTRGNLGPVDKCDSIIDKKLIKKYFSSLLDDEKE